MAADSTGPTGNPNFLGAGAPATAVDLNLISDWAAERIGETAADTASLPTTENRVGRLVFTEDFGVLWLCVDDSGSGTWRPVRARFADVTARDAAIPSPAQGMRCTLADHEVELVYLAAYNSSSNKGGAAAAGWYPVGGNVPRVTVTKSANQTIASANTDTVATWDVELVDRWDMHDNSSNPSRFVAPVAGLYDLEFFLRNNSTSATFTCRARLNGTTDVDGSSGQITGTATPGSPVRVSVKDIPMGAGDYVEIIMQSTTTGTVVGGGTQTVRATASLRYAGPRTA